MAYFYFDILVIKLISTRCFEKICTTLNHILILKCTLHFKSITDVSFKYFVCNYNNNKITKIIVKHFSPDFIILLTVVRTTIQNTLYTYCVMVLYKKFSPCNIFIQVLHSYTFVSFYQDLKWSSKYHNLM